MKEKISVSPKVQRLVLFEYYKWQNKIKVCKERYMILSAGGHFSNADLDWRWTSRNESQLSAFSRNKFACHEAIEIDNVTKRRKFDRLFPLSHPKESGAGQSYRSLWLWYRLHIRCVFKHTQCVKFFFKLTFYSTGSINFYILLLFS